jgi:hypothetical protein
MTDTCNLCKKESKLKNSHILPEFMYQNLYDTKPKRFYSLKIDLENSEKYRKK